MSQAFISWPRANQQNLLGPHGKFAALFFDEVVFQVPRADFLDQVLTSLVDQGVLASDVGHGLRKVWRPVQAFLPDYEFLKRPWQNDDERLIELAQTVAVEEVLAEYPDISQRGLQREVGLVGAGLIEAVATWAVLQARRPCVMLADPGEARLVEGVFAISSPAAQHALFSQVMQSRLPSPEALSWERVFELRASPFLEAFRLKIAELDRLIREAGGGREVQDILDELERHDLRELAATVKPNPRGAWAKAVAANIPLPIPVNPVSIAMSAVDVKGAYDRHQRFGWLYFLLELDAV